MVALALGIPVSAVLLLLAVRGTDLGVAWREVTRSDPSWLLIALLGLAVFMAAGGTRWSILLRRVRPTRASTATAVVLAATALSNTVPGRPGDVARAWWAGRGAMRSRTHAVSTVVLDRIADVFVLTVGLIVGSAASPPRRGVKAILVLAIGLTCVLVALVAVAWVYVRSPRGRAREGDHVERARIHKLVSKFLRGLGDITPLEGGFVLLLTIVVWSAFGLVCWAVGRSVGVQLGFLTILMLTAVVNLGLTLPSSPGAIGTYQWLVVATLEPYGIPRATAFAYSILLNAVSLVPTTIVGFAVLGFAARRGLISSPGGQDEPQYVST